MKDKFRLKVGESNSRGCLIWKGARDRDGYGAFYSGLKLGGTGKTVRANRMAYELWVGDIPEGQEVLHSCDNPPCVNPCHLFLGDKYANVADRHKKGRDPRGEKNRHAKLTDGEVLEIRAKYIPHVVIGTALASEFGVSQSTVYGILRRKTWKHLV